MKINERERLMLRAALVWFVECVKSPRPYDMSNLTLGEDPLSVEEIESLAEALAEEGSR